MIKYLKKIFLRRAESLKSLREEKEGLKRELILQSNILNNLDFAVWRRNENLEISYCNIAYTKTIEGDTKNGSAENIELYAKAREFAALAIKNNNLEKIRKHLIVKGERKLFEITEIPVSGGTIGFANNITEIEIKENELKQHIEVQKNLLEASSSAIAIYGSDRKLKYFNYAFANLFKLNELWLETEPDYAEILESLRERRKLPEQANFLEFKKNNLAMFTNLLDKYEEFYYLPDGRVFRVIVLPHEHGGLLFNYENMTDQIALERSYNTLLSVNKYTMDNLHEGIAVFREDGRLQLSNPVYAEIWGLSSSVINSEPHISEILEETKSFYDYGDEWKEFKQDIVFVLRKRERYQKILYRTDGTVIEWVCVPLPDGATLMTYINITDSTRVERSLRAEKEALKEADSLKTNFLTNVSYELRSPLTSIKGFAEILLKKYFGKINERQEEYVEGILDSSIHLSSLIDNILDVSYIDAGYMTLDIKEFDLYKVIKSVSEEISPDMKKKHLNFKVICKKNIGKMFGDKKRIRQILINLLVNSIKLTDSGGKITLSATSKGKNSIKITVEDNGRGIPGEEQMKVFEKFYRLGKENRHSGTGLGLTIAKSFIELHNGKIELKSKAGAGTKFICTFKRKNKDLMRIEKKVN